MAVFELTATPSGSVPTATVAVTVFARPSITNTVLSEKSKLALYAVFVSGLTAIPNEILPTVIAAVTGFVCPLITQTVSSPVQF